MKTTQRLALAVAFSATAVGTLISTQPAVAQVIRAMVDLQPSTPGTVQTGNVNLTGTQTAGQFAGGASGVSNLNASSITTGTLSTTRLSSNVMRLDTDQLHSQQHLFPNMSNSLSGNGGALHLSATNISSGTLLIGRMSSNVLSTDSSQTLAGRKTFSNAGNQFIGSGIGLTNIPWSSVTGAPAFGQIGVTNTWTASNQFTNSANSFSGNGGQITGVSWSGIVLTSIFYADGHEWSGANTFTNANNTFVGRGDGLSALNASNFASGTLSDSLLTSNAVRLSGANFWTNPLVFSQSATLSGSVGIVEGYTGEFPLALGVSGGQSIRLGSTSGLDHTINSDSNRLAFSSAQSSSTIVFGDAYPATNEWARLRSAGLLVGQKTTTHRARIDDANGANGSAMLGNSNGTGTWGQIGSDRLASSTGSLLRVTGGAFSGGANFSGQTDKDITLFKGDGTATIQLDASTLTEAGRIVVDGYNGNANSVLSSIPGNGNYGYMSVNDGSGANVSQMLYVWNTNGYYNGVLQADIKNFSVPDPRDSEYNLVYAAMEGPEAAMYDRGSAQLVNGQALIQLPEHFRSLANLDTMTVQLTATGEVRGLYATKVNGEILVKELRGGQSSVSFDWEVKAVRKGFEGHEVRQHWTKVRPEGDEAEQWQARLESIAAKRSHISRRP